MRAHFCHLLNISAVCSVIGFVDNRYTKLGKRGEKVLLFLGLAHINLSPCWLRLFFGAAGNSNLELTLEHNVLKSKAR